MWRKGEDGDFDLASEVSQGGGASEETPTRPTGDEGPAETPPGPSPSGFGPEGGKAERLRISTYKISARGTV